MFNFMIQGMQLSDQTDLLQFGNPKETLFHTAISQANDIVLQQDRWNFDRNYFAAVQIVLKSDLKVINRKTNSIFDWLGEWGGLHDGLNFLGKAFLNPYTTYALQYVLSYMLVRFVPSSSESKTNKLEIKQKKEKTFFNKYFDN